jgi:hypothetical protein
MPDVSSNAPADVRLWVSLDQHKCGWGRKCRWFLLDRRVLYSAWLLPLPCTAITASAAQLLGDGFMPQPRRDAAAPYDASSLLLSRSRAGASRGVGFRGCGSVR